MKNEIFCDGGTVGDRCRKPIAFECACLWCSRDDRAERFHACKSHGQEAGEKHSRIRERDVEWVRWPP